VIDCVAILNFIHPESGFKMSNPLVAILMGSKSDFSKLEPAIFTLKEFNVPVEVRVMSAHRSPDVVVKFSETAAQRGFKVIMAAAGGAAHLAGVVSAHTDLPVIGIPVQGGAFLGIDALLATVQMPGGVPVATVAVGESGVKNAALFAVRILALNDPNLAARLEQFREQQRARVIADDQQLQHELNARVSSPS
jgi:phosphoribosylaminoimidazole carboxylase PurE protein